MSASQPTSRVPYHWDLVFSEFRDVHLAIEDQTAEEYIKSAQIALDDCDGTNRKESGETKNGDTVTDQGTGKECRPPSLIPERSLIGEDRFDSTSAGATEAVEKFMKNTVAEDSNGSSFINQAEIVVSFCRNAESDHVQAEDRRDANGFLAFVYDRENKPGTLSTTPDNNQVRIWGTPGPLTYEQLLVKLTVKRFEGDNPSSKLDNQYRECAKPDADRRLVYISNLDARIISILAKTTSYFQAPVLQRTIFQYLTARASLSVHIPTRGVKAFSLELHLSYFCLRKRDSCGLIFDHRLNWDGAEPLRKTWEFPRDPTSPRHAANVEFNIYETQLSFVVRGFDNWRWTGWAFVDTWFESRDSASGSIYGEFEDSGAEPDPLAAGRMDIDPPERDPRGYFLRIFEIRIIEVEKEWNYILQTLQEEVQRIGSDPLFASPRQSFEDINGRERIRSLVAWNGEMSRLVGALLKSLSRNLVAWDVFNKTDIGYFLYDDSSCTSRPARLPSLRVIERVFLNLSVAHEELEQVKWSLEELGRALARGERNYSTFVQQRTGEHVKLLTWVTIGWSPVLIATGMCSAQAGIFPFQNNIWDFLGSTFVIAALVGLSIIVLLNRNSALLVWKLPSIDDSQRSPQHAIVSSVDAPAKSTLSPTRAFTRQGTGGPVVLETPVSIQRVESGRLAVPGRVLLHGLRRHRGVTNSVAGSNFSDSV